MSSLQQLPAEAERIHFFPFIRALEPTIAGSRDRAIADDSDWDATMAAELLFLIETLEKLRI